jgi:hypothetical protein
MSQQQPGATRAKNSMATASLVCGIIGFVVTGIPLIGALFGGTLDILAVIFGIIALTRLPRFLGQGKAAAIVGIVLAGLSLLTIPIGAGTIW